MADSRINLLSSASSSASDDFFVVDGTTNGTRKLNAFSPTFGGDPTITGTLTVNGTSLANGLVVNGNGLALNTAGSASVRFQDAGTSKWWFYKLSADANLYFRDMVNGRMHMTLVPNTTSGTAISYLFSNLIVESTAASTTTSTGALVVGNGTSGGLGVGGAIVAGGTITSTASTDSGLLQLNLVNSSTGTSASSLFRFNAGTRTVTLQAYNDTHATLAGQLRVGTSNGDIVLVPSGVASATFGASSTTIGLSPSSTDALFSVTGTGTSGATKVVAHLENNFGTAALNNAAQLRFKIFNNSVGDAEFAAINGITDSVTAGARSTGLSFLTGQQTIGFVERMRISGGGAVSLSGGLLTISKSGAGSTLEVNADSGYDSKISLQRAATNRWTIECDTSDTLRFKSLGSTQVVAVTSSNLTFSGDLLFFANSTYDIGTTSNRVRQIFVRDIYSTFYTPASATDTGTTGRICYDSNYIYICTATNTWKRAAISTW